MTDAFEKLAELVGASVEAAPSQGLPRTRAEALVLGLTRYFTGQPCKHGHVAERQSLGGNCVECMRLCKAKPEAKERQRQYSLRCKRKPKTKEYRRLYKARPEVKERERKYKLRHSVKPETKGRERQYRLGRTGDAALFAINQAEQAARLAIAPADIVPQCPEPHRSQLQALIDRIRVDPTAGKAVVGLLQSMRELRKLELAEQNTKDDTTASST